MNVAEYISSFLKKNKINKVFMLTGYGAMYLNDAIKRQILNIMQPEMRLLHQ